MEIIKFDKRIDCADRRVIDVKLDNMNPTLFVIIFFLASAQVNIFCYRQAF